MDFFFEFCTQNINSIQKMKQITKWIFAVFVMLTASTAFSQGKISGTVVDAELNTPLSGVNVVVKGTSTGVSTDAEGKFSIKANSSNGELILTYIGYDKKTVKFTSLSDLGTLKLNAASNQLEDVVIVGKGVIDLAKDRKTPIAATTLKAAEIQTKVGSGDVTQVLVNTPSVYVAGQAGGFGDSRISVRGFQQDNTAFLLNGQPINGMEDGKMYWSNWSGMADIANTIQIQRGLGSSKLAISSVGGTVNFVTKATEQKQGGFAYLGIANDDYFKSTAAYNTGRNAKGWGASFMLSHWQGDGYNDGTRGEGQNYFLSVGYKPSDKHSFNFLITGAPQYHDQNFTKKISDYLGFGRRYNNNYGYLNGQYISERTNFYHKPVANLNWDYKISDKLDLSTVLYASWGRGGGTGNYGNGRILTSQYNPYLGTNQFTYINFNQIYANNVADPDGVGTLGVSTNYLIRASMNNHAWYGVVSNLKTKLTDNLSLNLGLDLRTYNGTHYRQVANYLGLNKWYETRKLFNQNHVNNLTSTIVASNTVNEYYPAEPWTAMFNTIGESQRIDYDYSETISYGGVFGQLEYNKDNFSAFFQGSISNQSHQRFDRYDYEAAYQDSEKVSNLGYNVKAGGSYSINQAHSFYVNTGYYSRQPYHDNVYLNYTNRVNPLASNEKILGLEAGYNYKSKIFSASLNAYRTTWEDRVLTTSRTVTATAGETIGTTLLPLGALVYTTNQNDQQLHTGVELDFVIKPLQKLDIKGFASFGNWEYGGNSVQRRFDENQNPLDEKLVDIDGGKVGDAAQTTYGLGAKYEIFERFSIDADWRNYDNLYANVAATKDNLLLPSYDLVDAGITYKMLVGKDNKNSVLFRVNMNNVFDEVYLSEVTSNIKTTDRINPTSTTDFSTYESANRLYKGLSDANQGFFGFGRTWNVSIKYNF
jgi:iron complex outermembrane receptor protein